MLKAIALYFVMLLAVLFYGSFFFGFYYAIISICGMTVGSIVALSIVLFVILRNWYKRKKVRAYTN